MNSLFEAIFLHANGLSSCHHNYVVHEVLNGCKNYRLLAKKDFADISYLKENLKPHLLRDFCTLCSGALVSDSL